LALDRLDALVIICNRSKNAWPKLALKMRGSFVRRRFAQNEGESRIGKTAVAQGVAGNGLAVA
jgi:hypothetical protein